MAGMPPQPGAAPPQPPPGQGAPMGAVPPKPPAPIAPPPPQPAAGNVAGITGAIPGVPSPFQDVSQDLPHHWQMIDGALRIMKRAIATGGFYQQPEARAALQQIVKDGDELVHRYSTAPNTMGPNVSKTKPTTGGDDSIQVEPAADTSDDEGGT